MPDRFAATWAMRLLLIGKADDDASPEAAGTPDRGRHSSTEEEVLRTTLRTISLYAYTVPPFPFVAYYDHGVVVQARFEDKQYIPAWRPILQ